MSTLALTAIETAVDDLDTYVSSAVTFPTRAILPPVDDGGGPDVAVGTEIRFEATGGSPIIVLTADERIVGVVPGRGQAVVVAEAGAQESEDDFWRFQVLNSAPMATIVAVDSTVTDAVVAHALTAEATDSPDRVETDTALDALGAKVNAVIDKAELLDVALTAVIAVLDQFGLTKVE